MADSYRGKSPRYFQTGTGHRVTWTYTPHNDPVDCRTWGTFNCTGCEKTFKKRPPEAANDHALKCREVPE